MTTENKIKQTKNILKNKKVAIAFSGGADSTLLAYLSSIVAKETLAITVDNHLFPTNFIENTKKSTKKFNIQHKIIDINFYEDKEFLTNNKKRCYNCRELMYNKIKEQAKDYDLICDGNNISDLIVNRPGILITYSNQFTTPLIEARLTSKEIHEYLDKNKITYYKSTTCLATRIPTNTPVTKEKIDRIRECEDYIYNNTQCEIVKVRDYEETALCEVDNIKSFTEDNNYKQINNKIKSMNFKKVSLNLTEIEDNEYILLDYNNGTFTYQLPYTINIKETKKQLKNKTQKETKKQLKLEKITINENGKITGKNYETYNKALNAFMNTLCKIRRNI